MNEVARANWSRLPIEERSKNIYGSAKHVMSLNPANQFTKNAARAV
jgi:hypothetical protein